MTTTEFGESGDSSLDRDLPNRDAADAGSSITPEIAAAAIRYPQAIEPFNRARAEMTSAEDAYTASSSAKTEKAAEAKFASAASQAAVDLNASRAWPHRVSSDVIAVTASLQAMATAAHQMAEADTPEERDAHHGEFSDAETAHAVSAAALRKGLGLPQSD